MNDPASCSALACCAPCRVRYLCDSYAAATVKLANAAGRLVRHEPARVPVHIRWRVPSCQDQGTQSLSDSLGHRAETWGRCSLKGLCFASPPLDGSGVSNITRSARVGAARTPAAVRIQPERKVIRELDQSATNLALGSMIQIRADRKSQLHRNILGWYYSTDEHIMQQATGSGDVVRL